MQNGTAKRGTVAALFGWTLRPLGAYACPHPTAAFNPRLVISALLRGASRYPATIRYRMLDVALAKAATADLKGALRKHTPEMIKELVWLAKKAEHEATRVRRPRDANPPPPSAVGIYESSGPPSLSARDLSQSGAPSECGCFGNGQERAAKDSYTHVW